MGVKSSSRVRDYALCWRVVGCAWMPAGGVMPRVGRALALRSSERECEVVKRNENTILRYLQQTLFLFSSRSVELQEHTYTMPGRTRPIDKLATAVGKCSKEVHHRHHIFVDMTNVFLRVLCTANAYSQTTPTYITTNALLSS
jgi:hypothetical protein